MISDSELNSLILPMVKEAFGAFGLKSVKVASGLDHDGDPIVDIRVQLAPSRRKASPDVTFALTRNILAALRSRSDERFPLIRVLLPDSGRSRKLSGPDKGRHRRVAAS